ncbi:MAG: dockerin type I domain-containing protein [Phycisphaerales bacterium]
MPHDSADQLSSIDPSSVEPSPIDPPLAIGAELRRGLATAADPGRASGADPDAEALARTDAAVMDTAEAHFRAAFGGSGTGAPAAAAPGVLARIRPWTGLGVAAALLLALLPGVLSGSPGERSADRVEHEARADRVEPERNAAVQLAHDLDNDGRITLVDAFVLARSIESADQETAALYAHVDLDGDGFASVRDAERLADLVVRGAVQ